MPRAAWLVPRAGLCALLAGLFLVQADRDAYDPRTAAALAPDETEHSVPVPAPALPDEEPEDEESEVESEVESEEEEEDEGVAGAPSRDAPDESERPAAEAAPLTDEEHAKYIACVAEVENGLRVDRSLRVKGAPIRVHVPAVCKMEKVQEGLHQHAQASHACFGMFTLEVKQKLIAEIEVRVCTGRKEPYDIPKVNMFIDTGAHKDAKVEILGEDQMKEQDRKRAPGDSIATEQITLAGQKDEDLYLAVDKIIADHQAQGETSVNIDVAIEHDTNIGVILQSTETKAKAQPEARRPQSRRWTTVVDHTSGISQPAADDPFADLDGERRPW